MRALITSLMIGKLEEKPSELLSRIETRILMNITAEAFGIDPAELKKYRGGDALENYASFTIECMKRSGIDTDRLYERAYAAGRRIAKASGIIRKEEAARLVFLLYRNIGISMFGNPHDEVIVTNCFFSRFYTPEQCRIMSEIDSGIVSGITGSGKLRFTHRITEGCRGCRAYTERKQK